MAKKILTIISLIAALSATAYAADVKNSDSSFTVSGTESAGSEVRLSVYDKDGKLVWIDSATAGGDGAYSFSFGFDAPEEKVEYKLYVNGAEQAFVLPGNAEALAEISAAADSEELEAKLTEYAERYGYDASAWSSVSDEATRDAVFSAQLESDGVYKAYMTAVGIAAFNDAVAAQDRSAVETALLTYGDEIGATVSADKKALSTTKFEKLMVEFMKNSYQTKTEYINGYNAAKAEATKSESSGGGGGGSSSSGGGSSSGSVSGGVGTVGAPVEKVVPFDDLAGVAWAEDSILDLYNKGVISGKGYKTFAPNDDVKREEFVAMLTRMLGLEDGKASFDDVAEDAWYAGDVGAAYSKGLINGVSETMFGSGMPVTREDCAVICRNLLTVYGVEIPAGGEAFADDGEIADYARDAVYSMRALGVISGVGENSFAPKSVCSRAMAAKIIDVLGGMVK